MVKVKAVVLLVVSGILFVVAALMVLMNWKNTSTVHVFVVSIHFSTAAVLFYAAVAGGLLWVIWRFSVPRGLRLLKQSRRADDERRRQARFDRLVAEDDARTAAPAKEKSPGDKPGQ